MKLRRFALYHLGLRVPRLVLAVAFLATLGSLFGAARLKIGDVFTSLLPQGTESVASLKRYADSFGEMGNLVVTVESEDPATAERFADVFSEKIRALPEVGYVDFKHPVDFFLDRKWLFVDLKDLQEMKQRIDRSLELQAKGVSTVFNNLMIFADPEDRPDMTFQDIEDKYQKRYGFGLQSYQKDEAGTFLVLSVKAKGLLKGTDAKKSFVAQIRGIEGELLRQPDFSGVRVGYTGAYENEIEGVELTQKEIARVSGLVFALLLLILLFYFRRIDATLLVGVPLLVGIVWTGGVTYLALGHLNLLTASAASILGGLGSDYGIYLLSRYYEEREAGKDFEAACHLAFGGTGRATFASVVTMVGAFLGLLFSRFNLFVEFGAVGAIGLVMNYLAMMLLIPSALNLTQKFSKKRAPHRSFADSRLFRRVFFPKRPVLGLAVVGVLVAVSLPSVFHQGHIEFESGQVGGLKIPSNVLYERVSRLTGQSLNPTVLITNGPEEDGRVVSTLGALLDAPEAAALPYRRILGLSSFIPSDTDEKKKILGEIYSGYEKVRMPAGDARQEFLRSLKTSIAAGPVTRENLPREIRQLFESPKDPNVLAAYLFPSFARTDSSSMMRYEDQVMRLKEANGLRFAAVDGSFLSADAVRLVEKEAVRGGIFLVACLAAVLLVTVRPFARAWVILGNMLIGTVVLSGLLSVIGIRLNVLNIAAVPIILGTGVDSFFHFSFRFDEMNDLWSTLKSKVAPVFVSNLTSIVGFGGLLLTSNGGLHSVGWVAVLGLALVTLVCFFVFPRCLALETRASVSLLPEGPETTRSSRTCTE